MRSIAFRILIAGAAFLQASAMAFVPPAAAVSPLDRQQLSSPLDTALIDLRGYPFPVRHSPLLEARARTMADHVVSVLELFGPRFETQPAIVLLVLASQDWAAHTGFPIYGMPHILEGRTLIVAGEDNPFWRGQLPDPASLPDDVAEALRYAYDDGDGGLSAAAFFDLLAIHELGHAFIDQSGLQTQRRWMGEFLPNLILHAWVEEEARELLPALTLIADLVVAAGPGAHPFTTLADIDRHYVRIAREHSDNYAWYQLRWHQGARRLYEAAGTGALDRLWTALRDHPDPMDDAAFLQLLDDRVHRALGDFVRNWDAENLSPAPLHLPRGG
jgi:hypothetical protein